MGHRMRDFDSVADTQSESPMTPGSRVRIQRRPLHGVLLLDKPLGLSSNDALQKAKWLLRAEKAGHTGTLDPLATGVLPLCFGAATKFSQIHLDADKTYEATLRLGQNTTTGDAEGQVLSDCEFEFDRPTLLAVLRQFTGPIQQVPPMFSALKHEGKPLYEYARAGIVLDRPARSVCIHHISLCQNFPGNSILASNSKDSFAIKIVVACSKGTYIRTLAEDIGKALGCGAHLSGLRRIITGPFDQSACLSLDQLAAMSEVQRVAALQPVEVLLHGAQKVTLSNDNAGRFLSGMRRSTELPNAEWVAVYGDNPRALLGSAHISQGELIPTRLLSPIEVSEVLSQQQP